MTDQIGGFTVTHMRPGQTRELVALLSEMQLHYGAACPSPEAIAARLTEAAPGVRALLAHDGAALVGFAFFFSPASFPAPASSPAFI